MEVKPGYKRTEVGSIPEEWDSTSLGDGISLLSGHHILASRCNTRGIGVPYITGPADFPNGAISHSKFTDRPSTVCKVGDILVTVKGSGAGSLVVADAAYCISRQLMAIRASDWDKSFVFYSLLQNATQFKAASTGLIPGLSRSDITDQLLPLPPLPEQRAIAAALSDVDALLGGLDRLIVKKRDLKQAAMQQLLTGQTRLPGFSGTWDELEFGEIASIRNAKVFASSVPSGTQCVELESIGGEGSGRLLMSTDAAGMSSKYSFKKGDVLFGRLRAYLRKFWLATFDGICSTEIWPLIARDVRLCGAYLHLLVQTENFVDTACVSYGTHMPRSDWTVLTKLLVRLPPVPVQTAIATVLSDMDAELAALEARRDKTRDLKQAMMQELLTGKTRLVKPEAAHA